MARSNWPISKKELLGVGFTTLSLLGLLIFIGASQQPTNTRSDAAYCNNKPTWKFLNTTNENFRVIYHLKLINNCSGSNNFVLNVIETPTQPRLYTGWKWRFANGETNTAYEKPNVSANNNEVNLTVTRPYRIVNGDYIDETRPGDYYWIKVKASLANNPAISDTINLYYTIK